MSPSAAIAALADAFPDDGVVVPESPATTYEVPVTFLVLRNEEYAILKWLGEIEQATGAPGMALA